MEAEIYLDAAATTPPRSDVIEAIVEAQRKAWGNPSSLHNTGVKAAELLERLRWELAQRFAVVPDQLIFTSGATESVHLAIVGSAAKLTPGRIVVSGVEHPAVLAAANQLKNKGWTVAFWPVDALGLIRLECLEELLAEPTRMVSLIAAQSEVGALQPTDVVGQACRARGITFHSDATQLIPQGCPEFNHFQSDLVSLSAHKFQGPRGIGLLIRGSNLPLSPVQGGGGQEFGLRSGTEALPLIAGMAQALSVLPAYHLSGDTVPPGSGADVRRQRDDLLQELLEIQGLSLLGPNVTQRSPNHIAVLVGSAEGQPLSARAMVRELARRGVACSSGSACRSGQRQDSSVLTAMNVPEPWRQSGLRFTLGPWLDDKALKQVPERVLDAQRALS